MDRYFSKHRTYREAKLEAQGDIGNMTFKEVPIGSRFILHTDVKGGHGPYRKMNATKVVGVWNGVMLKMANLDAPVEECVYCLAPLCEDGRLEYTQLGDSFAHTICIPSPEELYGIREAKMSDTTVTTPHRRGPNAYACQRK
jgi:hypothetical protein